MGEAGEAFGESGRGRRLEWAATALTGAGVALGAVGRAAEPGGLGVGRCGVGCGLGPDPLRRLCRRRHVRREPALTRWSHSGAGSGPQGPPARPGRRPDAVRPASVRFESSGVRSAAAEAGGPAGGRRGVRRCQAGGVRRAGGWRGLWSFLHLGDVFETKIRVAQPGVWRPGRRAGGGLARIVVFFTSGGCIRDQYRCGPGWRAPGPRPLAPAGPAAPPAPAGPAGRRAPPPPRRPTPAPAGPPHHGSAGLADARQRVADEHVDDPGSPESGEEHHDPGRLRADLADSDRVTPERMCSQRRQRGVGLVGRHDRHELALVGDVQRVDSEQLASRLSRPGVPAAWLRRARP